MIPPALDTGEPNSTMANQIAYSPKETILEEYFCIQMLPSSFETKWCSIILCKFAFNLYVNCQQQMPYRKGQFYRFKHVIALMNQCKPKSKMVKPRLAPILVTPLTKPNGSRAGLQKADYQYFVHILFTTQSMIRYCRIYMYIFPHLYLH